LHRSEINGDLRRKSPIFPTRRVFIAPAEGGYPWNWVSAQGSEETRMMGLSDGRKSCKIGLAVVIQYRRVTDTQPAIQPRCVALYRAMLRVARVKMQ